MSSVDQNIEKAVNAAKIAVKFDQEGQVNPSAYYYEIAAKWLDQAAQNVAGDKADSLRTKSKEYRERARVLTNSTTQETPRYVISYFSPKYIKIGRRVLKLFLY